MNNNIIIKSLLNGGLTFILITLVCTLKGMTIEQTLAAPYTIFLVVSAIAGSFIGFAIRTSKQ